MVDIKELKKLTASLHVLYVEDNVGVQRTMATYLKKLFASTTLASSGSEGLELYKKNSFDIVITDLSMPNMNGSEMIAKIREFDERIPILITTAHTNTNYLINAIKSHVDGYIIKPFDYTLLNVELFKVAEKIQKYAENEAYKKSLKDMLDKQTKEMSENYKKTIYSMIELIEQRDTYTAGHSKRVAYYCKRIAQEMGYSDEEITLLHQAGILHDIGKIETPDSILLNPNTLNDTEYALIQEHVTVSYKLLKQIPMFAALADIIYQHHERYDGSGYPNGLKGNGIHPLARIMIVADAFDAMTTNRIYKGRKSVPQALQELQQLSTKQFDPDVVVSALKALKNVTIDVEINQFPKTKLEEERFAYFYKDNLTHVYNQNYLDVILAHNSYENNFNIMQLFYIHNFSQFNVQNGWDGGDTFLKEFAQTLHTHLEDVLIFRIFGDDFAILSKEKIKSAGLLKSLDTLTLQNNITYTLKTIDLKGEKIEKLADLRFFQR